MPYVEPVSREQLAENEPYFKIVESALGFLPGAYFTMGRRPEILRAFTSLVMSVECAIALQRAFAARGETAIPVTNRPKPTARSQLNAVADRQSKSLRSRQRHFTSAPSAADSAFTEP